MLAAVITAAGSSIRMEGQKKEYLQIDGIPVLVRSLAPFLNLTEPTNIIVTVPEGHIPQVSRLLETFRGQSNRKIIEGGGSRQESVWRALEALETDAPELVLIHDGARPWVRLELVQTVIAATRKHYACIPVLGIEEAPKLVQADGFILENLDRERTRVAQTPQCFVFTSILKAYRTAGNEGRSVIDDAEVYGAYIGPVFTVPGDRRNIKITYPEDLKS